MRPHHSIPAAPRHNIGNLDKMRNQEAGYQMKKMAEGLANINLNDHTKLLIPNDESNNSM